MELLAPAGTLEGFKAVLAQKPDVIYLGAGDLNARSDEAQFSLSDLKSLVEEARSQAVKIYFTLNVLIKDSEMARALEIAGIAHRAGVAAFIVQDKGLMLALKATYPDIVIHASTQCSVGSREQILELKDLNVKRVVLARELSLEQIADLTDFAHKLGIEIEVFTHGATCMSVSGQCHMSFGLGGRSANRGECAQPCRKQYRLLQNKQTLREAAALLSPKDLSYFPYIRELIDIEVDALKIEGRLRSPEYQAQVSAIFKTAIREIEIGLSDPDVFTEERKRNLQIAFNRGGFFQAAFLKKQRDASFLSAEHVGHFGYYLGEVAGVIDRQGILLYTPKDNDYLPSEGSQISLKNNYGTTVATAPVGVVRRAKGSRKVEIKGFHPKILRELRLPLSVWQQKQENIPDQEIRATAEADKIPVYMNLSLENETYILQVKSGQKEIKFNSDELDLPAESTGSPLDLERIEQQLAKLGNTPYKLSKFTSNLKTEELPSWRISTLNAFRRAAINKFLASPDCLTMSSPTTLKSVEIIPTEVKNILNLPNYQAGDDLSGLQGQEHDLIVLPLEELSLVLEEDPQLLILRAKLGQAHLGAYFSPLRAWSCKLSIEESLKQLSTYGLAAVLSAASGTREILQDLNLDLEIFLWQGAQVSNSKSFEFFSARGYHGIMISPELSQEEQEKLALRFQNSSSKPILFCHGPLEAMFTRFCPIGNSQVCGLCRQNKGYKLKDEEGRIFPLTPKMYADCSLQIWQETSLNFAAKVDCIRAYNFVEYNNFDIVNLR